MVVIMAQPAFHGRKALAGNAAFKSENKHTNFVLLDIAPCHYHPAVWANQLFVPFLSCKLLIRRVGSSNWPGFVNGEHDSLLSTHCSVLRPCNFNYPSIFCNFFHPLKQIVYASLFSFVYPEHVLPLRYVQ